MPLQMTASPATFSDTGYSVVLLDPNRIEKSVAVTSLAEAKTAFDAFVASLPPTGWAVHALWGGRDKAPRGFKAARERNEFQQQVRPAALAA